MVRKGEDKAPVVLEQVDGKDRRGWVKVVGAGRGGDLHEQPQYPPAPASLS